MVDVSGWRAGFIPSCDQKAECTTDTENTEIGFEECKAGYDLFSQDPAFLCVLRAVVDFLL